MQHLSPNQKALRRLRRNRSAMFGLAVIVLAVWVAIFAYYIAPDPTTDANDQVLELANLPPMSRVSLLLQAQPTQPQAPANAWQRLLYGVQWTHKSIPISGYSFVDNGNMVVQSYLPPSSVAAGLPALSDTIAMASVAYALSTEQPIRQQANTVLFVTADGKQGSATTTQLRQLIEQQHLVQRTYYLGSDKFGRDNLSRLLLGVRVSLSVGLMAVLIALLVGISMGLVAGYFGGRIDDWIVWLMSVFWSIPLLLLVFAMVLALGREFWQIYLAVGLTMWVEVARMVRGQVMVLRKVAFVEAAHSLGASSGRIMLRHLLPNIMGAVAVVASADFASAIIIEAGLSFLGIGVQPPTPSWGSMLNEYYAYIGTSKAFLAIIPGAAIMLLVLAFNLLGNGLRDALDVKG